MSKESEVTEYEQERIRHLCRYCEDCGCLLEFCCKPKKPVVSFDWLKDFVERKKCMERPWADGSQEYVVKADDLLLAVLEQVEVEKNE